MSTVQKFNDDAAPWLRLLTPALLGFSLYFLNNINHNFERLNDTVGNHSVDIATLKSNVRWLSKK